MVIRFFGILLGNTMNNWGLQIYVDPFVTTTIDYTDPRWIGAWWFTPMILGLLFIIPAVFISRFPKHIRPVSQPTETPLLSVNSEKDAETSIEPERPSMRDMLDSLKRLSKNKIVVYSVLSYVAKRLSWMPFDTYMVKYMEQLYNIPTADAK